MFDGSFACRECSRAELNCYACLARGRSDGEEWKQKLRDLDKFVRGWPLTKYLDLAYRHPKDPLNSIRIKLQRPGWIRLAPPSSRFSHIIRILKPISLFYYNRHTLDHVADTIPLLVQHTTYCRDLVIDRSRTGQCRSLTLATIPLSLFKDIGSNE